MRDWLSLTSSACRRGFLGRCTTFESHDAESIEQQNSGEISEREDAGQAQSSKQFETRPHWKATANCFCFSIIHRNTENTSLQRKIFVRRLLSARMISLVASHDSTCAAGTRRLTQEYTNRFPTTTFASILIPHMTANCSVFGLSATDTPSS